MKTKEDLEWDLAYWARELEKAGETAREFVNKYHKTHNWTYEEQFAVNELLTKLGSLTHLNKETLVQLQATKKKTLWQKLLRR